MIIYKTIFFITYLSKIIGISFNNIMFRKITWWHFCVIQFYDVETSNDKILYDVLFIRYHCSLKKDIRGS